MNTKVYRQPGMHPGEMMSLMNKYDDDFITHGWHPQDRIVVVKGASAKFVDTQSARSNGVDVVKFPFYRGDDKSVIIVPEGTWTFNAKISYDAYEKQQERMYEVLYAISDTLNNFYVNAYIQSNDVLVDENKVAAVTQREMGRTPGIGAFCSFFDSTDIDKYVDIDGFSERFSTVTNYGDIERSEFERVFFENLASRWDVEFEDWEPNNDLLNQSDGLYRKQKVP